MADEGVTPGDVSAVFLTHEHSDHVLGLSGFAGLGTPVYATRGTAGALQGKNLINWKIVPSQSTFALAGVTVESFPVPHDAAEPVGWVIDDGVERLVWALDVGHLVPITKKILRSATILVLESNYCPQLLEADKKRPFSLKQRIKGRHGHLSNDEAFEFITMEKSDSWRQIYLAHLSHQCNDAKGLQERYTQIGVQVQVVLPVAVKELTEASA